MEIDILRVMGMAGLEQSYIDTLRGKIEKSKRMVTLLEKWFDEESEEECEKIMNKVREKSADPSY
jgi:predicted CopG family antitoxin